MPQRLSVVQFTHQGKEHKLTPAEKKTIPIIMEWNTGPHRRKFMRAKGQTVVNNHLSPTKDLLFWGEWEPYSQVELLKTKPTLWTMPSMVHRPFMKFNKKGKLCKFINRPRTSYGTSGGGCTPSIACQGTDPFVFGDHFIYSNCKQVFMSGTGKITYTSMRELEKGSVILFGSTVLKAPRGGSPYFILDTVFVVDEYREYHVKNALKDLHGFVPPIYDEIMNFKSWSSNPFLTCYHGATWSNPVNGMFSFVPCKSCESDAPSFGFERPILRSSMFSGIVPSPARVITDNLNAMPRYFDNTKFKAFSISVAKDIWEIVKTEVEKQGFELGVRVDYDIK